MQGEFAFGDDSSRPGGDPFVSWREQRRVERQRLAGELGLPLGDHVEVWLKGGVRLRGVLRLDEEVFLHAAVTVNNTRFFVGETPFFYREMESCRQI